MDPHNSVDDLLASVQPEVPCFAETTPTEVADRAWRALERRERRQQRMKLSAALAVCYLAGLLTMRAWMERREIAAARPANVAQAKAHDASSQAQQLPASPGRLSPVPDEREVAAAAPDLARTPTAYARFRRLGNAYLRVEGGIEEAAECYSLALEAATDEERSPLWEEDSWLLIALKTQSPKEA